MPCAFIARIQLRGKRIGELIHRLSKYKVIVELKYSCFINEANN